MNEKFEFTNPALLKAVDNFIMKKGRQTRIFIRFEEIEVLLIGLMSFANEEWKLIKTDKNYLLKFMTYIKDKLENKSKKLLFLVVHEGMYVIIDSSFASHKDWESESQRRDADFLVLMEKFFLAKETFAGIKTFEDYMIVTKVLKDDEEKIFFGNKKDAAVVKRLIEKYQR